jgi:chromate reductase, NAD(P)H dehydrogenase (quinone)
MKILAISGSLRADSLNTKLLHAAAELVDGGVDVEVWDGLKAVPPYDEDDEAGAAPIAVARLRSAIAGADAVLFATPEYNASIPGQLKNAIDWVSRPVATNPLRNVPVAVIGASPGMFGAVWAQAELKKVVALIGARVIDAELPVAQAATRFDADGRLVDDEIRERLAEVLNDLVTAVEERQAVQATG